MARIKLLSIDLSNYCSKECDFCYNHSKRSGNIMWKPSEVISFAKDCISNGVEAVSLGGGEPFEYDGIFEVIAELQPLAYLSVTTNGLPLLQEQVWENLMFNAPDKVHITIHNPNDNSEVNRVMRQIELLALSSIKPGVNLLVSRDMVIECKRVYQNLRKLLNPSQIILVPRRFSNTPSPEQMSHVTVNEPFLSASCLLKCTPPDNFASVSWDKRVNQCSYAGGKERLENLTFDGLLNALNNVKFKTCVKYD